MVNDSSSTYTDHTTTTCGGWEPSPDVVITKVMVGGMDISECFQKKEDNMRGLYRIIVVDPKTDGIFPPELVVAKDETQALLKARLEPEVHTNPEQYDFCVDRLGDVRAKKDVQKVKVVTEEGE